MNLDYAKLKFLAGLEVHQQLDTSKLFCRCPGYLRKDEPDFSVRRKLHAVAGEGGEVDAAVEYEALLDKDFEYQGYDDTTCLIELDEEPPKEINESALDEVLKIALLMNCEIYQMTQVMRKTVIDGSNTAGFQRTVLVAHTGFVETSFGRVGIESVALEEDSARVISRERNKSVYRLDRLGIPLIEIVTAPDMRTPEQVKEVALKIGEILRATRVKRGIGTIRQDVNVSSKGHERVEIKGFQDPRVMVKTIDLEVQRQQEEAKAGKNLGEVRNALPNGSTEFLRPMPGEARMYPETDLPLLKISRERINKAKKNLPKLKSEIRSELKKKGLTDELIGLVLRGNLDEFETLMKVYSLDSNLVAKMVSLWRNELATKKKVSVDEVRERIDERVLEKVLKAVKSRKIDKSDVREVMEGIFDGKKVGDALKVEKAGDDEVEEEIAKIVKSKPGLSAKAYMGLVMKKFGGKVDAKKAMEIVNKLMES